MCIQNYRTDGFLEQFPNVILIINFSSFIFYYLFVNCRDLIYSKRWRIRGWDYCLLSVLQDQWIFRVTLKSVLYTEMITVSTTWHKFIILDHLQVYLLR